MKVYSDCPEGVALILMQIIEEAENKEGRRERRTNVSERQRLIDLYKDCLSAVTGMDCNKPPGPLH